MDYKTQSILTVTALLAIMVVVGVSIGQLENSITGAAIEPACQCTEDAECDDNNPETNDICINADKCLESYCLHK